MAKKAFIELKTDLNAFKKQFNSYERRISVTIRAKFIDIATECIKLAQTKGNYTDRTGNLRKSIGAVLYQNGKMVWKSDVLDHPDVTETLANIEKSKRDYGLALFLFAGMHYAGYVEALGYDVATCAKLRSETLVNNLVSNLLSQL